MPSPTNVGTVSRRPASDHRGPTGFERRDLVLERLLLGRGLTQGFGVQVADGRNLRANRVGDRVRFAGLACEGLLGEPAGFGQEPRRVVELLCFVPRERLFVLQLVVRGERDVELGRVLIERVAALAELFLEVAFGRRDGIDPDPERREARDEQHDRMGREKRQHPAERGRGDPAHLERAGEGREPQRHLPEQDQRRPGHGGQRGERDRGRLDRRRQIGKPFDQALEDRHEALGRRDERLERREQRLAERDADVLDPVPQQRQLRGGGLVAFLGFGRERGVVLPGGVRQAELLGEQLARTRDAQNRVGENDVLAEQILNHGRGLGAERADGADQGLHGAGRVGLKGPLELARAQVGDASQTSRARRRPCPRPR